MIQRIVGTIFKRCFASVKNVAKIGSTSFPTPTTLLVVGVIHGGRLQRPFYEKPVYFSGISKAK